MEDGWHWEWEENVRRWTRRRGGAGFVRVLLHALFLQHRLVRQVSVPLSRCTTGRAAKLDLYVLCTSMSPGILASHVHIRLVAQHTPHRALRAARSSCAPTTIVRSGLLGAMRVLSSSQLVSVLSVFAVLGLGCGVLADPDHGSVWPQSGLSGLAVAKDMDAVLYLDNGYDLSSGIPLRRLVQSADVSLSTGVFVRLSGDEFISTPPIPSA
ncbi:hypothetical protein PENSPDRAFT_484641 [Peniophora sp. CONT]|nr:hypothetical protein PENSPDRAFT_484641 [Peniophora sp. CONT]